MERRMIAASFVEEALDPLRRRGLPTAPLLAAAGLPERVVDPVSPQSYGALWLAIAAALDDAFFGLAGRPMRPGSFTLLCHCVLHARTLGQALRRARRFLRVALDDPYGALTIAYGLASVTLIDAGPARRPTSWCATPTTKASRPPSAAACAPCPRPAGRTCPASPAL